MERGLVGSEMCIRDSIYVESSSGKHQHPEVQMLIIIARNTVRKSITIAVHFWRQQVVWKTEPKRTTADRPQAGEIWVKMTDFEQTFRSRFDPYNVKISWSQLVFDELKPLQTLLGVSKHFNNIFSWWKVALKAPFWGVPGYPSWGTRILTDFRDFKSCCLNPPIVEISWSQVAPDEFNTLGKLSQALKQHNFRWL